MKLALYSSRALYLCLHREVLKTQPLLDFDYGGQPQKIYQGQLRQWLDGPSLYSPGFRACVAVRWRDYKWIGLKNKVYRQGLQRCYHQQPD